MRTKATLRRGSVQLLLIRGESAGYSRMVCTISVTTSRQPVLALAFGGNLLRGESFTDCYILRNDTEGCIYLAVSRRRRWFVDRPLIMYDIRSASVLLCWNLVPISNFINLYLALSILRLHLLSNQTSVGATDYSRHYRFIYLLLVIS